MKVLAFINSAGAWNHDERRHGPASLFGHMQKPGACRDSLAIGHLKDNFPARGRRLCG